MFDFSQLIGKGGAYAGVGSRRITSGSSVLLMKYACCMTWAGMVVHSGAADGSDTSFEWGARIAYDAMCQLDANLVPGNYGMVMKCFLPWKQFNGRDGGRLQGFIDSINPNALGFTSTYHPGWDHLKSAPRDMMARNAMQVMDEDLMTPVRFLMCETPDAAISPQMTSSKTGGTGQAIRIAAPNGVRVYNIKNPEHRSMAERWISDFDAKIQTRYGVSPIALVEEYLEQHKGLSRHMDGDLIKETLSGKFDVLVHGANCQNAMGSGIAKAIKEVFPEAYQADSRTKKGDKSKLGSYTKADVVRDGREITILNAYTQDRWGREDILYADYQKIRDVFKKIAADFPGKRIGIPRIGAGLSNGCWVTISNIISHAMKGRNITLVDLPEDMRLALEMEERKSARTQASPQMGMGF
jgi:O-acetyl-ADP-ribose deacetylase (regulator of RNase III)